MWPFKKKSTLTAITTTPHLAETFPIVGAKDNLPSWYKTTPLTYQKGECPVPHSITNKDSTIKNCTGVNNLLRTGFILSAWEDISLVVYPDGTFSSVGAATNPNAMKHDKRQLPASMQHYTAIKLFSPWFLYGDATEYLFMPVPYHDKLSRNYFVPSGIVNFKYQHSTNVFLCVEPKKEPYEILIKAGQPLIQILPLTEKNITLKVKYDPTHHPFRPFKFFLLYGHNRYVSWMKRNRNVG